MFPKNDTFVLTDLNGMDKEMEGEYRPGHFNGVVHVVHNLFKHVQPNAAYFGEKDFQQLAIIKHITKKYNFEIEIKSCVKPSAIKMDSRLVVEIVFLTKKKK